MTMSFMIPLAESNNHQTPFDCKEITARPIHFADVVDDFDDNDIRQRHAHAQLVYNQQFGDCNLPFMEDRLNNEDRLALFEATLILARHTSASEDVDRANAMAASPELADILTASHIERLSIINFIARNFDKAAQYSAMIDSAALLPRIVNTPLKEAGRPLAPPRLLVPSHGDDNTVGYTVRQIDLPQNGIVVISHPQCVFSAAAMEHINDSDRISAIFRERSIWIFPPSTIIGERSFPKKTLPAQLFGVAYRYGDFPQLDNWDLPSFYFFRDGRLVHQFTGWPRSGESSPLLEEGLRRIAP